MPVAVRSHPQRDCLAMSHRVFLITETTDTLSGNWSGLRAFRTIFIKNSHVKVARRRRFVAQEVPINVPRQWGQESLALGGARTG